ncbi:MAG: hypothetical protein HC942_19775 [Microcoleus sp. SU_5_6]|nr:hypothetical protein [Microcoleus sp. SU_5_6]NJL67726.1 hypothetical protein [Microcoleus sp. SM1_3_4]
MGRKLSYPNRQLSTNRIPATGLKHSQIPEKVQGDRVEPIYSIEPVACEVLLTLTPIDFDRSTAIGKVRSGDFNSLNLRTKVRTTKPVYRTQSKISHPPTWQEDGRK